MNIIAKEILNKLRRGKRQLFPSFDFIAMDITSNCNLRCPFCVNDFSQIKGNTLMKESTFKKVVTLFPLISGRNVFFSCLFEPSIHPAFIDFLEMIPAEQSRKIFLTTNLAKRISDEDIDRLSRLEIGNINISVDSFTPEVFETLRKGAKFELFIDNLDRLTSVLRKRVNAPEIRFITVILKDNLDEVPKLIDICSSRYSPMEHEFRSVYQVGHLSREWRLKNLISNDEWSRLQDYFDQGPNRCSLVQPPPSFFPDDEAPYSRKLNNGLGAIPPLALEIRSNGTVTLLGRDDFKFAIDEIEEPFVFFDSKKREFSRAVQQSKHA